MPYTLRHHTLLHRRAALPMLCALFGIPAHASDDPLTPLPNSRKSTAPEGDLREAWLFGQTRRYPHFVLGDPYEATSLAARDSSGKVHTLTLPENAVFEDREARLLDLDGNGKNEIAVVVSTHESGAALALYGLRGGRLERLDQTHAIGQPYRWLNPSGVGRFTQREHMEIAIVRTPHLSGILETWALRDGKLTRTAQHNGYATHRNGSRHQRLYAVIPKVGGGDRLAVPSLNREALVVLDLAKAKPEVARFALSGKADGPFALQRTAQGWQLDVPLEGGRSDRITLPPME